jgi:hypothetical protein
MNGIQFFGNNFRISRIYTFKIRWKRAFIMKIDSVNLLSSLPGSSTIEGGTQSLLENGAIPEEFSNALIGQIGLLSDANDPAGLPRQLQDTTESQMGNNVHNISDSLKQTGGEEELATLLEYLPASYKKTGAADLNEDVDLEATLLVLTDALKAITPATIPDDVATAQNMSEVMALNGLSFAKPLQPEETKLNMMGKEDVALGDALQKETVLRQLTQNKPGVSLSFVENANPSQKTLVIENQASLLGIEKEVPGVAANMVQFHSPVDDRTDSPTITKPLTHPDWSKELGEQIVWMSTKALSAAEIRLNPAHLGPISVRIDVNQDQATVMFTAQHAGVKEAIDASIPKLREMLATQQLNLVNVTISQNSTSDQGRSHYQNFSKTPDNNEQGIDSVAGIQHKVEHELVIVNKGLLSIYA